MSILVVDDFISIRKALSAVMSSEGFRVFEAGDGIEALEIMERESIDAVISDILMPNMDGYRLCTELRRNEKFRGVPFIFFTSTYTSPSDEALALELGADKFIRKPSPPQVIVQAVRDLLNGPPRFHTAVALNVDLGLTSEYTQRLVEKLEEKNEELGRRTQELRETGEKLQAVIRAAPVAILSFDKAGKVRAWNPAAERIFGWSEADVLGQRPLHVGAEDREEFERLRHRVHAGETIVGLEVRRCRRDGTRLDLELNAAPLKDADGNIVGELVVLSDITAQCMAREALRQSERRFAAFMDNMPAFAWMKDLEGRYVYANKMTERLAEFRGEWRGKTGSDILPESIAAEYHANDQNVISSGHAIQIVEHYVAEDETRHMLVSKFPILDESGAVIMVGGASVDITPRIQAEEALRESDERFRQLAENIEQVFWIRNVEPWRLDFVSPAYEKIWKRSIEDLRLHPYAWLDAIHTDDRERTAREAEGLAIKGEFDLTYRIIWPDGSIRWIHDRAFPVRDAQGRLIRIAGIAEDITERKRAEQQVENLADMLKILSNRLFEVQEEERSHLARELHDEIGQSLTAAKMEIEAAKRLDDPAARALRLDDGLAVIEHLLQSVRTLSLDLRPALLDELGLSTALCAYAQSQGTRGGLAVQLAVDKSLRRCHPAVEIACFRVAQEALTNVLRHAHAKTVQIGLCRHGDQLQLRVGDDGIGFDVAEANARVAIGATFGLLSMRERVNLAGGTFLCKSAAGQGTEIEAHFLLIMDGTDSRYEKTASNSGG